MLNIDKPPDITVALAPDSPPKGTVAAVAYESGCASIILDTGERHQWAASADEVEEYVTQQGLVEVEPPDWAPIAWGRADESSAT